MGRTNQISRLSFKKAQTYISNLWEELERYNPHDDESLIGVPNPYIVPSLHSGSGFSFNEQYYWDTYFIIQGLLDEKKLKLAKGMVENLCHLMKRLGSIPNASRFYFTGKSQPPFLTSMIMDIYEKTKDKNWLFENMLIAKEEYRKVWLSTEHPHWRKVFRGLSRYYQIDVLHSLAETESGWDMNPRFSRSCLDFVPIDLNALLYKYEVDFAQAAEIAGDITEAKEWIKRAKKRKGMINIYMWNKKAGFYFDYDYVNGKQSSIWSLAGFFPLWSGMVDEKAARRMVKNLKKFEHIGGLVTTSKKGGKHGVPEQWAYPNGWAPLHWLVIKGLEKYGYHEDAKRIALKWLKTNLWHFEKKGLFLEKYNVVKPTKPASKGVYPTQTGFAWTNAIFLRLVNKFFEAKTKNTNLPHFTYAAADFANN